MSSIPTESQQLALIRRFVNTVDLEDGSDVLAAPAELAAWLWEEGLTLGDLRATRADLRQALEVRDALRELARANNAADADVEGASAVLDAAAGRARLALRFREGAATFEPETAGIRAGIGAILAAAAAAMADGSWPRLKACRSDTCRWLYYDSATNSSRAWCSMRICGNREKARAYRKRHGRAS
jgi:predicted RNA-binding Zn ribbon-like protein